MVVAGRSLRVVFFGTPDFAVPSLEALLDSHHAVVGVVTQPDRPRGRGQRVSESPAKRAALARGIPVLQPDRLKDESFLASLRAWRADAGVVAAYGKILPAAVLETPALGLINVHASLLPRHRGAAPVHRAVIAGDAETGVSIMRVVQALDAGGVFKTAIRPIGPDDTSADVEYDLARLGAALLLDVLGQLAAGTAVEVPQDDTTATYAHRLRKEEGLVDWRAPAAAIHNQVRGLQPWPMAWTSLGGRRLIVIRTRAVPEAADSGLAPGSMVHLAKDAFRVQTGSGLLDVLTVQPEGRRAMAARDFAAGHLGGGHVRFDLPPDAPAPAPPAGAD
jgi:methionyl-tRNA formyltransferase